MDPTKTLEDIRDLCKRILDYDDESYAIDLATSVEVLDKWISGGGFLPGDWKEV